MFESHIAFGVTLLAVVAAAALLGFSAKTDVCCKSLMKTIAYVSLVLGGLNLLCSTYYTVKYWEDGYFKTPYGQFCPMKNGQGGMGMMNNNMMNGDMMKMMQNSNSMPNVSPNGDTSNQDPHHPDKE